MNRDYEIGYEARYETCTQLYKKRDLMFLRDRYVQKEC